MLRPKNLGAVWALVALLALVGIGALTSYRYQPKEDGKYQQHAAENLQEISSISNGVLITSADSFWRHTTHSFHKLRDDWIAASTVLLTLVTGGLLFVGYQQILTSKRQLRAYVFVNSKDLVEQGENGSERFVHDLEIRNTGQTPAKQLWVESVTCTLDHPLASTFVFPIIPHGANPSVMTLGASEAVIAASNADEILSDGDLMDIRQINDRGRRLYTYGTVRYRDIFNKSHYTNFSFFLQYRIAAGDDEVVRWRIAIHPSEHHNDAE
jgi:hypothetical protein